MIQLTNANLDEVGRTYGFGGVPGADEGNGAVDVGNEFGFEEVTVFLHFKGDVELTPALVFPVVAAMGAAAVWVF